MNKIVIVPNPNKDPELLWSARLCTLLRTVVPDTIALPSNLQNGWNGPADVHFEQEDTLFNDSRVIIALGGDGSIIRTALLALERGSDTPVLGLNLGRLGYLAEGGIEDAPAILSAPIITERRRLLETRLGGEVFFSLNDAVVCRDGGANIAEFSVLCDDAPLGVYRADGVIAATPTGSTAYSLSAGGPVVDPTLDTLIITPICPHTLSARPIVLSPGRTVSIENMGPRALSVNADGRIVGSIECGEKVYMRLSERYVNFVCGRASGFFEKLREKLT